MTTVYLLLALGLGAGTAVLLLKRARALRHACRADNEHRARQQRLDRLSALVDQGATGGHFSPEIADRLRRFTDDMRAESRGETH